MLQATLKFLRFTTQRQLEMLGPAIQTMLVPLSDDLQLFGSQHEPLYNNKHA
jgi:hypothetical protein